MSARLGFMRLGNYGLVPVETTPTGEGGTPILAPAPSGNEPVTILPYEPPPSKLPLAPADRPVPVPAPSTPTILIAPPIAAPLPVPAPVSVADSIGTGGGPAETPIVAMVPTAPPAKGGVGPALVGAAGGFFVGGPIGAAAGAAAGLLYGLFRR